MINDLMSMHFELRRTWSQPLWRCYPLAFAKSDWRKLQ